jgi:hypothetical protein
MKSLPLLLSASFLSLLALAAAPVPLVDLSVIKSLPKTPVLTKGCEGECCGILKTNKATQDIVLYDSPSKSAKKVGTIKKGESFEKAEFFTKILKFGEVSEGGRKLTVLSYLSEGNSVVWDGKEVRTTQSDEGYREAKTESWAQIKSKSFSGWANLFPKDGKKLDYGWCG